MNQIVKRPRGRPPTDKTKAVPNKEIIKTAPNKEPIKATRGRPKTNKENPEQKQDSMKTNMDKNDNLTKPRQLRKSKTIVDVPKIKANERDAEKNAYKQEMQIILRERLRQGKAKVILDQNITKLEARMNKL